MNIILTVDDNFFLNMEKDSSIMEGDDITILLNVSDNLVYNNIQLDYRNGKYRDRDYTTDGGTTILGHPYNRRGCLELQVLFDTSTLGLRKTNTVNEKVHKSIHGAPCSPDLEELYEAVRILQNRVTELEGGSARIDNIEEQLQQLTTIVNNNTEAIAMLNARVDGTITNITYNASQGLYILTYADGDTRTLNIPARVS